MPTPKKEYTEILSALDVHGDCRIIVWLTEEQYDALELASKQDWNHCSMASIVRYLIAWKAVPFAIQIQED